MFCFWRRQSVVFSFVYEIFRESLNRFAPNSHGRRAWSLARTSLKVKVKDQDDQGQKRHFSALSAACVRFMFGKTSLACSLVLLLHKCISRFLTQHDSIHIITKLECGPMPNLMVALPNTGGALCSTPQSLADAHY